MYAPRPYSVSINRFLVCAIQVSKDVRRLRRFEQTLLMDYQLFLTLLDDTVKSKQAQAIQRLPNTTGPLHVVISQLVWGRVKGTGGKRDERERDL